MKRNFFLMTACLLLSGLLMISCSKDKPGAPGEPEEPENHETVTPVGTPAGQAITKSIGAAGGEIASADGRVRLIIPAGAVNEAVNIGIQPITNQLAEGIGAAYRFTPHGQQFNKPVQVVFNYKAEDTASTRQEGLDIAFQDATGSWQMMTNTVLDKTQKKLSALTTHFSDWGYFKSIKLTPAAATVEQQAFLELKLTTTFPYVDPDDAPPGTYTVKVLKTPRKLRPDEVKGWDYAGEGKLEGDGYQGFYTAPDHVPSGNPESIAANIQMHRKGQFMLIANVTVIGDDKVKYLIVDEDYKNPANHDMCVLYLYGSFGADPGEAKRSVKVNSTPLKVDLWTPDLIRCRISEVASGAIEVSSNNKVVARSVLRKFKGRFLYERYHGGLLNAGSSNALKERAEFELVYRGFGKPKPAGLDLVFPVQGALAMGTEVKYGLMGSASVTTPVVDGCTYTTSVSLPTTTGFYFLEPRSLGGLTGFWADANDIEGGIEIQIEYLLDNIIENVRVQRSSSCGPSSFDPPKPLGVSLEGFNNKWIKLEFWGTDELKLKGTGELKSNRLSSSILIEAWDGTGNPSHYETDGLVPAVFRDNP